MLENVKGLIYKGKDEGLSYIKSKVDSVNQETGANYSINWQKVNAAEHGVPQLRERIFIVGSRDGRQFAFPKGGYINPNSTSLVTPESPDAFRNTWDAIGDLPGNPDEADLELTGKWAALLPTIPEGYNYLWHTSRNGRYPYWQR